MRSLGVILCIGFFSPPLITFSGFFFLTTDVSQMSLQSQQRRWRYHIIPSSTCEQKGHFSWDMLNCDCIKPECSILRRACTSRCGLRQNCSSDSPSLRCTVVPYWGLCCSSKNSPRYSLLLVLSVIPVHSLTAASNFFTRWVVDFCNVIEGWWVSFCARKSKLSFRCTKNLFA